MKRFIGAALCSAFLLTTATGCGIIESLLEGPDISGYSYMDGTVDYAYFYDRDEDVEKISESDVAAALVAAVLSGVFEDNYIDVSTFSVTDLAPGYSLYSGDNRDQPSAVIGCEIEVTAISADDFNNEKYHPYTLTKTIELTITYGQHWKVGSPVGDYKYIKLSDYDGGFDGYKQGLKEGARYGWFNIFANEDDFDINNLSSKFQTIYQDYQTQNHTGSSASDGGNVSDWYQAYQTLLEQYQDLTSESDYYRQYYLPDINRDGIPDLVLHLGTYITETTYHVFTFADGTLHECGNCSEKNGIEPEKIQTATVESETILSEDSSTTYFSLCYHGYQRTRYFRMTMDYQLECEDYSSKSDGQEVYDIPGEQLESCDIASLDLLNKAAGQ